MYITIHSKHTDEIAAYSIHKAFQNDIMTKTPMKIMSVKQAGTNVLDKLLNLERTKLIQISLKKIKNKLMQDNQAHMYLCTR